MTLRKNIKPEKTDHKTCDHAEYISTMNMSQHLKSLGRASSRSKIPRPSKRFFPPCTHCGCIDHLSNECLYYPICGLCGSYDHDTNGHNRIISLEREINPRIHSKDVKFVVAQLIPQLITMILNGSKECDIRKPIWYLESGCLRHMTGVKSYLHKYVEQPGPKVLFGDYSTCTTEGYGSIKCNGIFNEKRGTIFNSNKEVVMIASRVRDVYVLYMTSSAQESCFFAKASKNLNWLWHKQLAHLNFKTINKLGSFKTKQTSTIKKCLHLLHMDLFRPVTPRSINHEKYTLVIVNEYLRYTWVYFLKKKSQAHETIMSFIQRVKIKMTSKSNNSELTMALNSGIIFLSTSVMKWVSQNFSSPYTPEQNGAAEMKNRTLIEAARIMLSGYVFSKQY
ncbi:retrovirus-related pol polyprotein from transposon TNT 1-94 [Tanacetum coccineum]